MPLTNAAILTSHFEDSSVQSPLPAEIQRSAQFDGTGIYRYRLTRLWNEALPELTFVMLNPSRADAQQDDPTLRRCIGLAVQWGYGGLVVVNLFAYCTASPQVLKAVVDPIGTNNDSHILHACQTAGPVLLAWGNWGKLYQRDRHVLELLNDNRDCLYCLGRNRTGQPRHPLYVPRTVQRQRWG